MKKLLKITIEDTYLGYMIRVAVMHTWLTTISLQQLLLGGAKDTNGACRISAISSIRAKTSAFIVK
jgi:hypothetical protein